jgi:hypothetical protein
MHPGGRERRRCSERCSVRGSVILTATAAKASTFEKDLSFLMEMIDESKWRHGRNFSLPTIDHLTQILWVINESSSGR